MDPRHNFFQFLESKKCSKCGSTDWHKEYLNDGNSRSYPTLVYAVCDNCKHKKIIDVIQITTTQQINKDALIKAIQEKTKPDLF